MPHRTARTIGKRVVPTASSASGSWQLGEVEAARRDNIWPATGDPYFSSVSLLLPMDGANGSTTFTDESNNSFTVTANGNAQISTTQSKFGGASAAFDGSGDYLSVPDDASLNFGSDDFTIEFWVFLNSITSFTGLLGKRAGEADYAPFLIDFNNLTPKNIRFLTSTTGSSFTHVLTANTATPTSTWIHIAAVRSSGTLGLYQGGTLVASSSITGAVMTNSAPIYIGRGASQVVAAGQTNGYIDDFRITKGVARYTAAFTPPTAPHPTS